MNRNILILFMSWLGVTGYICRTVLTEQKLGSIE